MSEIQQKVAGEKLLLASVIRRAAYDIVEYRGSTRLEHRKIWKDAYDWLYRSPKKFDDPLDELMSFLSICETLSIDPNHIRAAVRMMSKQDIKRYQLVERRGIDSLLPLPDEDVE